MRLFTALAATTLATVSSARPPVPRSTLPIPTDCGIAKQTPYNLTAAPGWKYTLIASGLQLPRTVVFDTAGNLLVLEAWKGLSVHTLDPLTGCIASSKTLISNPALNHGLTLSPDGQTLYVSSMPTAWSYSYDAATQTLSNEQIIVSGMNPGGHPSRTLAIPSNNPNLLVVSLGSEDNIDHPSINKETGRAIVKVFDLSQTPAGGWNYNTQGWYLGYGLRNEIALVFDGNNHVWGVENSGDNLERTVNGQTADVHHNNPAEELNYLGDPAINNEQWYGYPTCWTVGPGGPAEFLPPPADRPFTVGEQFVIAPNSTFNDSSCAAQSTPPRLTIQAHSAPIDGKFDRDFDNMYVSLHGSWNRVPATGYKIIEIPFKKTIVPEGKGKGKGKGKDAGKGKPKGKGKGHGNDEGETVIYEPAAAQNDPNGYNDILWTDNVETCTSATCLRPSGIAWQPDWSRMYVASDGSVGELYVLYKE
ncbi:L-sorbosone dehydrogenase [Naviculisporaceae sp. PSN 640]